MVTTTAMTAADVDSSSSTTMVMATATTAVVWMSAHDNEDVSKAAEDGVMTKSSTASCSIDGGSDNRGGADIGVQ